MPSRPPPPFHFPPSPPPPEPPHHHHHHHLRHPHDHANLIPPIVAGASTITCLIFIAILYRTLSLKRTAPADPKHKHRFSYSVLRRATSSFSAANRLGQGGFGSVYKATLPSGQEVAVKVMDASGSLQGEREFHNELSLGSRIDTMCCDHVVSILGFSSNRRRLLLVYEYMQNGSLQSALLDRKCPELMDWKKRFAIATNIAEGIQYLHCSCNPPIVHGDIKPSNILLDWNFNAKIADFGLARLLTEDDEIGGCFNGDDNGSILEEIESVTTEEVAVNVGQSPESCVTALSPEMGAAGASSPSEGLEKTSVSESCFDRASVDGGDRRGVGRKKSGGSGREWWWKRDSGGGGGWSESGREKDYVVEWIGSEIKKKRPNCKTKGTVKSEQNKGKKNRKPREWWKEEFCEELTKEKKKRGAKSGGSVGELWWQREEDLAPERKRRRSKGGRSSIDWWLDGFSGEFRSGDIPKSGGVGSTPSMRGTVCYIAPESGGGGQASEKCDVYSYGVLLLVLVSGRRPLQVTTSSPMPEFEKSNLISWARQLARNGKLLDLVDPSIQSLDRVQALLCITIALLCLQKSPEKRPTVKEVVGMFSGKAEPPHLPFEFSPSPPSNLPFTSQKMAM